MHWQPLQRPAEESWFNQKLRKETATLGADVDKLLAERAQIDKRVATIRQEDPTQTDLTNTITFPSWTDTQLRCLQSEILLRRRLQAYYDRLYTELAKQQQRANDTYIAVQAEIRQILVELGWHDVPANQIDPSKIQPIFVMTHPKVREARELEQGFSARLSTRKWSADNARSISEITEMIAQP